MATFAELCDDVYTVTGRPDLVGETKLAVKAATLKAHQLDFFFKDIFETGIKFDNLDYTQQLELRPLVPNFRALKYFRRYDNGGTGAATEFYEITTPLETVDSYGADKVNIAYLAGSTLNVKSSVGIQYALLGVYVNPSVVESNFNSWVAVDHPYVIVFEAARSLYKQIGFDEQSAAMERLVAEQVTMLKTSNITSVGY